MKNSKRSRLSYRPAAQPLLRGFYARIALALILTAIVFDRSGLSQEAAYTRSATLVTVRVNSETIVLRPLEDGAIHVQIGKDGPPPEDSKLVLATTLATPAFDVRQTPAAVVVSAGSILASVDRETGALTFMDAAGKVLLAEKTDGRKLPTDVAGAEKPTVQDVFLSPRDEYIFGGGQFQDGYLNIRDLPRRMTQVNTQISIPFFLSSKGYGLLWHNFGRTDVNPTDREVRLKLIETGKLSTELFASPTGSAKVRRPESVFSAEFEVAQGGRHAMMLDVGQPMGRRYYVEIDGKTVVDFNNYWLPPTTSWFSNLSAGKHSVRVIGEVGDMPSILLRPAEDLTTLRSFTGSTIDYVVVAGPRSDEVIRRYRDITGAAPLLPAWAFGYIHCRARYYSQKELLTALDTFREKQIPLDLIVQDWMYWGKYGWNAMRFDETDYSDPAAMVKAVHAQHAHLMVSVWSRIGAETEIGKEFKEKKLFIPGTEWVDFFDPEARALYWKDFSTRMVPYGIDAWWLDATEPENDDLHGRTVATGSGDAVRLLYPLMVNRTVYEGLRTAVPDKRVMLLTRSAFLGQQRYAAANWSGDVGDSFDSLKRQITGGLDYSASGFPYWTTDTGGFFRPGPGQFTDTAYHERFVRWFEFSTFTPLLRVHGWLTPTEPWLYGPEVERIARKYLDVRYRMLPYTYSEAAQITLHGSTLFRPLVMDFPNDKTALEQKYEFMFGGSFLVAPVLAAGTDQWSVYLPNSPAGWVNFWDGQTYRGGQTIRADAPLDQIPVFVRGGSIVPLGPTEQWTGQKPDAPIEIRVYPGADAAFSLYDDDGNDYDYEKGAYSVIPIQWNDRTGTLTIGKREGSFSGMPATRKFSLALIKSEGQAQAPRLKSIVYDGTRVTVDLH